MRRRNEIKNGERSEGNRLKTENHSFVFVLMNNLTEVKGKRKKKKKVKESRRRKWKESKRGENFSKRERILARLDELLLHALSLSLSLSIPFSISSKVEREREREEIFGGRADHSCSTNVYRFWAKSFLWTSSLFKSSLSLSPYIFHHIRVWNKFLSFSSLILSLLSFSPIEDWMRWFNTW